MNDLYSLRCETCGGYHYEDLTDDDDWDAIYRKIAEDLLSGADYKVNADLHLKTAKKLCEAIDSSIKPTREDELRLVAALKQNIYPFSAAKSFQQMLYYRSMMVERGSIIGRDQFIKKIADTGEIFNKKYLSAEYENAAYSAIMADKWSRFGDDEYLQYSTVGDRNVRPSHAILDKYTAPKTDSFWRNNYPPNGWGCRCTVVPGKANYQNSLTPKEAGNQLKAENKDTPFYNNVGESKIIFDGKHPYFNNVPQQLTWREYGMTPNDKIFMDDDLPKLKLTSADEFLNWWNKNKNSEGDLIFKDVNNEEITLESAGGKPGRPSKYFKEHILKKSKDERYQYGCEIENILKNPDEVWFNKNQDAPRVYLKYYENGETLKLVVNEDLTAKNLFKIEGNAKAVESKLNEARQGCLLYKKAPH